MKNLQPVGQCKYKYYCINLIDLHIKLKKLIIQNNKLKNRFWVLNT